MIFQLLKLWWYCWKNGLQFNWMTYPNDKRYYVIFVNGEDYNSFDPLGLNYGKFIQVLISKKPCRAPYKIGNRLRRLINIKLIKKRERIKKHNPFEDKSFFGYC